MSGDSFSNPQIKVVYAHGRDLDNDFFPSWARVWKLLPDKNFRSAVLVYSNSVHGWSCCWFCLFLLSSVGV